MKVSMGAFQNTLLGVQQKSIELRFSQRSNQQAKNAENVNLSNNFSGQKKTIRAKEQVALVKILKLLYPFQVQMI